MNYLIQSNNIKAIVKQMNSMCEVFLYLPRYSKDVNAIFSHLPSLATYRLWGHTRSKNVSAKMNPQPPNIYKAAPRRVDKLSKVCDLCYIYIYIYIYIINMWLSNKAHKLCLLHIGSRRKACSFCVVENDKLTWTKITCQQQHILTRHHHLHSSGIVIFSSRTDTCHFAQQWWNFISQRTTTPWCRYNLLCNKFHPVIPAINTLITSSI